MGKCFICVKDFVSLKDLQDHRFTDQHKINMERNNKAIDKGFLTFELFKEYVK